MRSALLLLAHIGYNVVFPTFELVLAAAHHLRFIANFPLSYAMSSGLSPTRAFSLVAYHVFSVDLALV
jgi:hypothetical protein